jgi:hypothetical protein
MGGDESDLKRVVAFISYKDTNKRKTRHFKMNSR